MDENIQLDEETMLYFLSMWLSDDVERETLIADLSQELGFSPEKITIFLETCHQVLVKRQTPN